MARPGESLYASRRRQEGIARLIAYIILMIGAVMIMIPFMFMVSTSLKEKDQIFTRDLEWTPMRHVRVMHGEQTLSIYNVEGQSGYYALLERLPAGKVSMAHVSEEQPEMGASVQPGTPIVVSEDDIKSVRVFGPSWENYKEALTPPNFKFVQYLRNTLIITFAALIGQVISCSLVAFGFARLRFPGRGVLFIMVLATMMLPAQVTMVPLFKIFVTLGWYDTFLPLIVPAFFATSGFFVFLLRQYFMGIPLEMDEAARIDGATTWQIFMKVLVPQAKPAIATVAIFSFMAHWNDFLGPLIYLGNPDLRTLALGLYAFQGEHSIDLHLLMAAATVVMLPLLLLFAVAQRYFIQGVVISGVKG